MRIALFIIVVLVVVAAVTVAAVAFFSVPVRYDDNSVRNIRARARYSTRERKRERDRVNGRTESLARKDKASPFAVRSYLAKLILLVRVFFPCMHTRKRTLTYNISRTDIREEK